MCLGWILVFFLVFRLFLRVVFRLNCLKVFEEVWFWVLFFLVLVWLYEWLMCDICDSFCWSWVKFDIVCLIEILLMVWVVLLGLLCCVCLMRFVLFCVLDEVDDGDGCVFFVIMVFMIVFFLVFGFVDILGKKFLVVIVKFSELNFFRFRVWRWIVYEVVIFEEFVG